MTMTEQNEKLPQGKYTFVGIDVDATGRRILDEVNIVFKNTVLQILIKMQITGF